MRENWILNYIQQSICYDNQSHDVSASDSLAALALNGEMLLLLRAIATTSLQAHNYNRPTGIMMANSVACARLIKPVSRLQKPSAFFYFPRVAIELGALTMLMHHAATIGTAAVNDSWRHRDLDRRRRRTFASLSPTSWRRPRCSISVAAVLRCLNVRLRMRRRTIKQSRQRADLKPRPRLIIQHVLCFRRPTAARWRHRYLLSYLQAVV